MASSRHQSEWKHLKGLQMQDWDDVPGADFSPSSARRTHASRQSKRQPYDDRVAADAGAQRRRERTGDWSGLGA
ncbi:MAG: hypothetical protein EPO01_17240 [Aquabacterium sp.]|nr:MAG: hypothetical protein EPO01_17240 [Aquabacterium sp.]